MAETVGSANMGKTMGIIGPLVNSGGFFGPMMGGLLLSSVGYWHTWSLAVLIITIDLTLRLAMVDRPKPSIMVPGTDVVTSDEAGINTKPNTMDLDKESCPSHSIRSRAASPDIKSPRSMPSLRTLSMQSTTSTPSPPETEATPLLPTSCQHCPPPPPTKPLSDLGFFLCILRQRRIISSMLLTIILATVYNSFNATLALHVQEVFQWGPRQVGLLFLALVGPSALLGPFAGWLRDAIGVRWPTIVGTGLATPLYVLIGLVGDERFPRMKGDLGKGICIGVLLLMGFAIELTAGMCIIEGTRMSSAVLFRNLVLLLIPMVSYQ